MAKRKCRHILTAWLLVIVMMLANVIPAFADQTESVNTGTVIVTVVNANNENEGISGNYMLLR